MPNIYKPLDSEKHEIRLLHIHPGPSEDEPSCSMSTVSLDNIRPFEALSYVWGDLGDLACVTFQNESFEVTRNLRTALTYLRHDDNERVIWIDALCINQKDVSEKTTQLPLMSRIYSQAKCVVIFLGVEDDSWTVASEYMTTMFHNPPLHLDSSKEPHMELTGGIKWGDPKLTDALARFFSRPWWQRVWTVQEFVLAQNFVMQIGSHVMPMKFIDGFRNAHSTHTQGCCYESWRSLFGVDRENTAAISFGMDNFSDRTGIRELRDTVPFSEIFLRYQDRHCYNPRDRIYGMLGLASNDIFEHVQPSYEDEVKTVYENVTLAMIRKYSTLDVLSQIVDASPEERLPSLPSWVPDWSMNVDTTTWSTYIIRTVRNRNFFASGGQAAAVHTPRPGVLATSAIFLDPTAAIGEPNAFNTPVPDSWHAVAEADDREYCGMEKTTRRLAFLLTVCGGAPRREGGHSVWVPDEEADEKMMADWVAERADGLDERSRDYANAVGSATWGRRVFQSKRGFIGLGPKGVREGDWVVVLPGGKVPFLVREAVDVEDPEAKGRTSYRVVGDGYVHGAMRGLAYTFVELGYCEMSDVLLI